MFRKSAKKNNKIIKMLVSWSYHLDHHFFLEIWPQRASSPLAHLSEHTLPMAAVAAVMVMQSSLLGQQQQIGEANLHAVDSHHHGRGLERSACSG